MNIYNFFVLIWNILSTISIFITIISFFNPNNIITLFIAKEIKKQKIRNVNFKIKLTQKYDVNNVLDINEFENDMNMIFKEFNPIFKFNKPNLLVGYLERRNFIIYNKIRFPSDEEDFLLYSQNVDVKFKNLGNVLNTLFDDIRLVEKVNNLNITFEEVNFKLTSDLITQNYLIKLLGSDIDGNFSIRKENEMYSIIYNGKLNQESLDYIREIIISLTTL